MLPAGDGLLAALDTLPPTRWAARLAGRVPVLRSAVRRGYRLTAARRGLLSRLVPDVAAPIRRPGGPAGEPPP